MLEKRDLILAFALHIAVVLLIVIFNQWQTEFKPKPERLMQVKMVSLQELQAMMQKPNKVVKPKVKPKVKPIKKPEPKPQPKKKVKPRPVLVPKKQPKVKQKVVEEDLDYDPFAPLESTPKKTLKKKVSGKKVLDEMLKGQLSDKEVNRYIAGMQRAVEQHWKVPMEMMDKLNPAWVELTLSPTGKVVSINILESSGSTMLDETLKKAIYTAAPFQVPTQQFELFRTNKIRFHPLQ